MAREPPRAHYGSEWEAIGSIASRRRSSSVACGWRPPAWIHSGYTSARGQLLEIARKNNIPILLTNQVYAAFDDKTKIKAVGGDILTYSSKCLIELQPLHKNKRKAILRKHRSIPEKEIEFEIKEKGIF